LVAQEPIAEFRRAGGPPRVTVETPDAAAAAEVLRGLGLAAVRTAVGAPDAVVSADLGDVPTERICGELVARGVAVRGLAVCRPSLEDVFVRLTGEGFDVDG